MKKVMLSFAVAVVLTLGLVGFSATPFATATQKAEAVTYSHCYRAINGERWCYRMNCTFFETLAYGCRDGWVRYNVWYS